MAARGMLRSPRRAAGHLDHWDTPPQVSVCVGMGVGVGVSGCGCGWVWVSVGGVCICEGMCEYG